MRVLHRLHHRIELLESLLREAERRNLVPSVVASYSENKAEEMKHHSFPSQFLAKLERDHVFVGLMLNESLTYNTSKLK